MSWIRSLFSLRSKIGTPNSLRSKIGGTPGKRSFFSNPLFSKFTRSKIAVRTFSSNSSQTRNIIFSFNYNHKQSSHFLPFVGLSILALFAYEILGPFETNGGSTILRRYVVFISKNNEKKIGEEELNRIKNSFKGKVLDPIDSDRIEVNRILQSLIGPVERGFRNDVHWPETSNEHSFDKIWDYKDLDLVHWIQWMQYKWKMENCLSSEEVSEKIYGLPMKTGLEMFDWEVILVDEPNEVKAFYLPGGKIVLFTGVIRQFKSPSEVAIIIGNLVGHAVSRHQVKQVSRENQWSILRRIFSLDVVKTTSEVFEIKPCFSPRENIEADLIGLLLAALAGYDPRVAPGVYRKLARCSGDYDRNHSSGEKRAALLGRSKAMENAISIYKKASQWPSISDLD